MEDLVERVVDHRERAIAKHVCHGGKALDLQGSLDFIPGFTMGRVANANAVVAERAVAIAVSSNIDVCRESKPSPKPESDFNAIGHNLQL